MLQKFNELTQKEKITIILVIVLSIILYLTAIVIPLTSRIEKAKMKVASLSQTALQIEKGITEYRSLPALVQVKREGSLLSSVEKIASDTSVTKNIGYLKPFSAQKGMEGAEVKLNNISGNDFTLFVHRIQTQQINITKASLKDNDLDGLWNVRLFVEG